MSNQPRRALLYIALSLNLIAAGLNVSTGKFFRETCDYCHQGHYRESLADRMFRRKGGCPTLHKDCLDYLCREKILKQWMIDNGFDASGKCEMVARTQGRGD